MAHRLLLALALIAPILLSGCQRRIGSSCKVSTDCSLRGDRVCDLAYLVDGDGEIDPGGKGECTIDGCTPSACPREGTCIQAYGAEFLSVACDPELEDRPQAYTAALVTRIAGCNADPRSDNLVEGEPVACNDCETHEVCLPEGLCADLLSVRTSCRKECSRDSQCRDGYVCRETGSNGVYPVATPAFPFGDGSVKICMPVRRVPGE